MSTPLAIKGIGEGLLVTVPDGDWPSVQPTLLQAIDERKDFFRGARLVLQLNDRPLKAAQLGKLRDALAGREIDLIAILSSSSVTQTAGADLGLALELPRPKKAVVEETEPISTDLTGDEAVLLLRTVRSGHSIRHPGHVVILGDVNPGAEVIAGGNIVVWGRVRGVVHAGAAGNENAVVCALDLSPTQLRIAGHITVSPDRAKQFKPEMAFVKEGQLIAEAWRGRRRR